MKIKQGSIVKIKYQLFDMEDNLLDSTDDEVLDFICGEDEIVEGLESYIMGEAAGFMGEVVIEPEQAFGEHSDELVVITKTANFDDTVELVVGELVETEDPEGEMVTFEITKLADDKVWLDANHPLAGMKLKYKVEVIEVQ